MSRFQIKPTSACESLLLILSGKQLAWSDPRSPAQWHVVALDARDAKDEMAAAMTALTAIAQSHHKSHGWPGAAPATLCLAPDITQHWLQTPPLQTQSLKELHAVSSARAKTLFGLPQAHGEWSISANWNASKAFLCTAISPKQVALIAAIAKTQKKLDLVCGLTLVLQKLEHLFPKNGWLAILLADRFYIFQRQQGVNRSIRTVRLPEQASLASCEGLVFQEWQREMLRTQNFTENLFFLNTRPDIVLGPSQHAKPYSFSSSSSSQFMNLTWSTSIQTPQPFNATAGQQNILDFACLTRELLGVGYAI